ncbi:hypothetical protein PV783_24815 [Chitinophaga sp. CC14]|uniref:hypothetical protein n=1 Tax=Chitinophaga sp. CC14 TaxID=3029199 RepID=UPI003B7CF44E
MEIVSEKDVLPIFNFSLDDLPGERWLPVYGCEKFALISQFGRVKRIAREFQTNTGAIRYYKERIYKSNVKTTIVFKDGGYHYQLICIVCAERVHYIFNVMRLVYYLFNKEFPFHNADFSVVAKNRNDLDIRPENLELIYRPDSKAVFLSTRQKFTPERKMRLFKNATYAKEVIYRRAQISCYAQNGSRICTFENIYRAHLQTKLSVTDIEHAIANPFTLLRDFYWRSGKSESIDTSLMQMQQQQIQNEQRGVQITQFDLNGNPINYYYSVAEAARDNELNETDLLDCIHGKEQVAGYFLWRKGYWDTPIPGL